jgi:cell division protein FtsI (penicillin-binding protein 3)
VSEILAFSSNVGSVKIAQKMTDTVVYNALSSFGFGRKSGVDLSGESKGILHPLPWRPHHFANISFGHGLSASAIQVASSYAAIANGGILKTPSIVRAVYQKDGAVRALPNKNSQRILSEQTTDTMKRLLLSATAPGSTGFRARVNGHMVAGKTGTAQKVNPKGLGYLPRAYISSFVGFAPVQDPQFVIYVAIDEAKNDYYGSHTAAPLFAKIAQYALRKAEIAPTVFTEKNLLTIQKEQPALPTAPPSEQGFMPDVIGQPLRQALRELKKYDLQLSIQGTGSQVTGSWPSPTQSLPLKQKVTLFVGQESP